MFLIVRKGLTKTSVFPISSYIVSHSEGAMLCRTSVKQSKLICVKMVLARFLWYLNSNLLNFLLLNGHNLLDLIFFLTHFTQIFRSGRRSD